MKQARCCWSVILLLAKREHCRGIWLLLAEWVHELVAPSASLHCINDRFLLEQLLLEVRDLSRMHLGLLLELLLRGLGPCFSSLQLNLKLNSL